EFRWWARAHCDVARLLGARMGLTGPVQLALRHLYERWDGKGMPGEMRGQQLPLAVRLMQVAQDADMAWQQGGAGLGSGLLAERGGAGQRAAGGAGWVRPGPGGSGGVPGPRRPGLRGPGRALDLGRGHAR